MYAAKHLRLLGSVLLAVLFFAVPVFAAPAKTPQYVEGEALVLLKNNTLERKLTAQSVERGGGRIYANSVAAKVGARAEQIYGALSARAGEIFTLVKSDVMTTEELIAGLEKDPNVVSAVPNYIFRAAKVPDDPSYSALWGMEKVNAPAAWEKVTGGDVYVAVLDTGVDYNHEDLSANTAVSWAVNFTNNSTGYMDIYGHGSHVSGTIGAVGNNKKGVAGVNWNTKIIPLKVLGDNNYGNGSWITAGVNKVVEYLENNPGMRIPAANLSIIGWWSNTPAQLIALNNAYWRAFKTLSDMNTTVIVVCAGNEEKEVGQPDAQGQYAYPASFTGIDNMIVVGAIDHVDKAASFTNWSETFVDLVAPGVGILSTLPGHKYSAWSGTSMATPHVAGAVALLASYRPDLNAAELKALILSTARSDVNPISSSTYNTTNQKVSRLGLLDVGAAIAAATIDSPVPVTSVSISPAAPEPIYTNDETKKTVDLSVSVLPENASIKTVTWTTDDPSVAAVGQYTGLVTAVGKGETKIRASALDGSGVSADVTVEAKTYATGISLSHSSLELPPGGTATLVATVAPAGASQEVTWSITGSTIQVTENGVVSVNASAAGGETAKVTATALGSKTVGSVTAKADITVKASTPPPVLVTAIAIAPSSLPLLKGETGQLTAQVTPENAANKTVEWSSDTPAVATVDENGLVTAESAGTATVKARALDGSGKEGTAGVTVTNPPVPVSGITLDRYQLNLTVGESYHLAATIAPANADNKGVSWSTADAAVAGVSQNGLVTAFAAGTTTIMAKAAGNPSKRAQAAVEVTGNAYVPATGLTLSPSGLSSLTVGSSDLVAATVLPANASNKEVSWESSQPAVATVTQTGYITAVSPGTTRVTAKAQGGTDVTAGITVTVQGIDPFVAVEDISVSPNTLAMKPGEKEILQASLSPSGATNKTLVWESSNPGVATVSGSNVSVAAVGFAVGSEGSAVVTAVSEGRAVVTATALGGNNVKVEIPVTVESDAPPMKIPTLPPGDTTVDFIGPPAATENLPLTSSVQLSTPAANAVLLITYPDGSVHFCATRIEGSTLVFTFTPPMPGEYRLDFTLIDAKGRLSEPTLTLQVAGPSVPTPAPTPTPTPPKPTPKPNPVPTPGGGGGSGNRSGGGGCDNGVGTSAWTLFVFFLFVFFDCVDFSWLRRRGGKGSGKPLK
ncbi:MAG: Ig-like domain-containing protein [Synergistaceae bacterium]|jgi:uncharacterized protein YjdB|nr:Ig-like domain-containing protein [Synergistaceae bacterium]